MENFWVMYLVVDFVAMCLLGRYQFALTVNRGRYKVKRRYADVVITVVAVVSACVLLMMIENESYHGVWQFLLDNVGTNVSATVREEAAVGAHLVIICVAVCYAVAARVFASIFSDARKATLEKQLSKLRRKRAERDLLARWASNDLEVGE